MLSVYSLSADQARNIQRNASRNTIKLRYYHELLENCYQYIRAASANGHSHCYFRIPTYRVGYPKLDVQEVISYIYQRLRENQFDVFSTQVHNVIFIGWTNAGEENTNEPPRKEATTKKKKCYF